MSSTDFDPGAVGVANGNYFGFPYIPEESSVVLLSAPWDVTTSYGGGAALGPQAIVDASVQLDFYHPLVKTAPTFGIATQHAPAEWLEQSKFYRKKASALIAKLEKGEQFSTDDAAELEEVNKACRAFNEAVYQQTKFWLKKNKLVGLVGGDHSTPLGHIKAISEQHGSIGVLQLDAHADLRIAYEGFTYSHASIMHNVLQLSNIEKLVQVGIRDLSKEEALYAENDPRIIPFYDVEIHKSRFEGNTWKSVCESIIQQLPEKVYISFDIDGLQPELCPNTGTPVPGGLDFQETVYLLTLLAESGKQIVGFDLNEVSPGNDEWDANVGARMLYQLSCLMHYSQQT